MSETVIDNDSELNTGGPLAPGGNRSIDFVSVNFAGTLSNPFFWIVVGVVSTVAVQYIFARHARKS